jgi:3'(2'), 5'-bisphosphate nucleotidase/myo-inositol-1(or 4)-monophosphatase
MARQLSQRDLQYLAKYAKKAALAAGQIILNHRHHSLSVKTKIAGSSLASQVVTEVDLLCQKAILKILLPISISSSSCSTFNLALLIEESVDDLKRLEKDYFWCIDPLDGTLPFIESTSGYAVSIALVSRQGIPHIGIIYDPIKDNLYSAIKKGGAFKNNQPWVISALPQQKFSLIFDRSFQSHPLYKKIVQEITRIAIDAGYKGINIIQHGGAVMNACWVLENAPACYFKFPKSENGGGSLWDYSATACLFIEIGAKVSNIFGAPLDLNRRDSCFMNHQGILYASDKVLSEKIVHLYSQLTH